MLTDAILKLQSSNDIVEDAIAGTRYRGVDEGVGNLRKHSQKSTFAPYNERKILPYLLLFCLTRN